MKPVIIIAFITFFLPAASFAQFNGTFFGYQYNSAGIVQKNHIQKEAIYMYNYNKKGIKDSILRGTNLYNQQGDLLKTIELRANKKEIVVKKNVYLYNQNNDIVKIETTGEWSDNKTFTEYEYDSVGNITGIYNYAADTSSLSIEKRQYDQNSRLLSVTSVFNLHPPFISKKYSYQKDFSLIIIQSFNAKEELQYSDVYEYDSITNSKNIYLDNDAGRRLVSTLFYDSQKRIIREKGEHYLSSSLFTGSSGYSSNKVPRESEHVYNPDGSLLETNIYIEGKKIQTYRHFYEYFLN